jgi:hypothetical protein
MIYLTKLTSQTINGQTAVAPEYFSAFGGAAFAVVPFGNEGWGILSTSAVLAPASDLFIFPDLTTTLTDSDVSTLSAFLANVNCPSDQIVSGMTWAAALNVIATIFLAAQALYGLTGSAIFTNGVGLDDTIGDSGVAVIAPSQTINVHGAGNNLSAGGSSGGSQQQTQSGPFDFSGVSSDDLIGDTLDAVSQQFTGSVVLGVL